MNKKSKNQSVDSEDKLFPFEKADSSTLAWLAGLLQSEGHFYYDKRQRSKSNDPDYVPPPISPNVRIAMIEKDLMEEVGTLLGQRTICENRKTSNDNHVYKVTVSARAKVEALCKCILPYIRGERTRTKVIDMLKICDEYNTWKAEGGRRKAAQLAAKMKRRKKRKNIRKNTSEE